MQELYYNPIYGRVYIVLGILFMIIFIAGTFILGDYMNLVYCLSSAFIIFIGRNMLKKPYIQFNEKSLILYSFWGNIREKHGISSKKDLELKKNRIYLNGNKLKFNSWFLRPNDWQRLLHFYELEDYDLEDVLVD